MRTTKRRLLTAIGATTFGGIAITQTSSNASASVSSDGLHVPESSKLVTEEIETVRIGVDATYQYESNVSVDGHRLTLKAGNGSGGVYPVDSIETSEDVAQSDSGTATLQGSLLETPAFSRYQFDVDEGETKEVGVTAELVFEVLRDGSVVASARARDKGRLKVSNKSVEVSADVGGEASFNVSG